jgi:GT2 family glycosyltransferase
MSARDADWRFLLPALGRRIEHMLLLGGTSDLAATVLDLGVAQRVSTAVEAGHRYDAAIILSGARPALADIAEHLSDDAALYWEIDRRTRENLFMTPARAERELEPFQLTPTGTYWVKPGFPRRHMYLPLGAPGAFRWYLDTLFRTPTMLRRLVKSAARALASAFNGLNVFAPCYAITAVRGEARQPALITLARAAELWRDADALQPVLLASGEADWNRIVLLLFKPGADAPSVAIKMPRIAEFNEQVEWEHRVLTDLNRTTPRPSVPQSSLFHWNGLAVCAETCVTGSSLNSRVGSSAAGALEDLKLTSAWLQNFNEHTTERVPAREWLEVNLVDRLGARYAALFGLTAREAHLFDGLKRALHTTDGHTLPLVWQHTDFGPWNVYRDGAKISVIDWEVGRRGPALSDLLYFATHWSRALASRTTHAQRLRHFEGLFLTTVPAGPLGYALHREVGEYMRRLGVEPILFPFILVYMLLEQAVERAERLGRLGTEAPARRDNVYCDYLAIVARHAGRLFSEKGTAESGVSRASVTVAIATMDRPAGLERCVTAILQGETQPAEIVIIDQSRGDATRDLVARSHWHHVVPVTYVRQSCSGLAASRNAAVGNATQPIVAFTDDDCIADGRWLTSVMRAFGDAGTDVVTGRILPLGPETPGFHPVSLRTSAVRSVFRGRAIPWKAGSGGNVAVRAEWLDRVGGFDERLGVGSPGRSAEDIDMLYRFLRAGATLRYEPDAVVMHERQETARRLQSRPSYGFGMGAFCALWARRYDAFAFWMLAQWCAERGRSLLGSFVRRRWQRVHEELLMLRGAMSGFAYGLTAPSRIAQ